MTALVDAARQYIGTPFRHLGRGAALDCVGLGWRAFQDCGVTLPVPRYYGRGPHKGNLMRALCEALGEPLPPNVELSPGDIACFRFREEPHHVGLIGRSPYGALTLIHADSSPDVRRVVEHRLDDYWRTRMLAVWRRPV